MLLTLRKGRSGLLRDAFKKKLRRLKVLGSNRDRRLWKPQSVDYPPRLKGIKVLLFMQARKLIHAWRAKRLLLFFL